MKKCIFLNGVILVSLFFVSIANAEEKQHWYNGFYVGGQVGYVDGEADHTFSNNAPSGDSKPEGVTKGLFVGYQKHVGNFVLGAEVDYEKPDVDGDFVDTSGLTSAGSIDFNSMYSIRAKLGYSFKNIKIAPYLTGGIAYCDVDVEGGPSGNPDAGKRSETYQGWLAGFGVERTFSEHFTVRIEYRYADYGSQNGNLSPGYSSVQMPVDLKTQSVQMGVYYQF